MIEFYIPENEQQKKLYNLFVWNLKINATVLALNY